MTWFKYTASIVALIVAAASNGAAHEIPPSITVHLWVKPEGHRLRVLARVPLPALRDINLPTYGPGYLDVERAQEPIRAAVVTWVSNALRAYEHDALLPRARLAALRLSLPSDRSFGRYEDALAHVTGEPVPRQTEIYWAHTLVDVLFEYPIRSDRSRFGIESDLARLGTTVVTVVRFVPPNGSVRSFEFTGDAGILRLDPAWHHAALRFLRSGFFHILQGADHLLFLLCLVAPFRRVLPLVGVVTAFTAAHSVTLLASALGMAPAALWFPPLIELLIAGSIVYMALENIVGARLGRRWLVAFAFGLVHGFGFSFALRESLQFAGSHLLTALLSFNIGVELGQIAVLLALVPLLQLAFKYIVAERIGIIILSALVAHSAWHWTLDRGGVLGRFRFEWPSLDLMVAISILRWMLFASLAAAAGWMIYLALRATRSAPAASRLSSLSARFRRKAAGSS